MSPHNLMAIVVGIALGWTVFIGCTAFKSSGGELETYKAQVMYCENIGRDAGSYQAYYDCTVKLGLRDGGGE